MNLQTIESIFSIVGNIVVAVSLYITLNEIVKSEKDRQREVANKVFIWWDKSQTINVKRNKYIFQLSNHSNEPVHNVVIDIEYGKGNTSNQNFPLTVGILPPGDFYVYYDEHIETSMYKKVIPVVYFSDSSDRHWKRGYSGKLDELQFDIAQDATRVPQPQSDLILHPISNQIGREIEIIAENVRIAHQPQESSSLQSNEKNFKKRLVNAVIRKLINLLGFVKINRCKKKF